jgi:hypothetical protein
MDTLIRCYRYALLAAPVQVAALQAAPADDVRERAARVGITFCDTIVRELCSLFLSIMIRIASEIS